MRTASFSAPASSLIGSSRPLPTAPLPVVTLGLRLPSSCSFASSCALVPTARPRPTVRRPAITLSCPRPLLAESASVCKAPRRPEPALHRAKPAPALLHPPAAPLLLLHAHARRHRLTVCPSTAPLLHLSPTTDSTAAPATFMLDRLSGVAALRPKKSHCSRLPGLASSSCAPAS